MQERFVWNKLKLTILNNFFCQNSDNSVWLLDRYATASIPHPIPISQTSMQISVSNTSHGFAGDIMRALRVAPLTLQIHKTKRFCHLNSKLFQIVFLWYAARRRSSLVRFYGQGWKFHQTRIVSEFGRGSASNSGKRDLGASCRSLTVGNAITPILRNSWTVRIWWVLTAACGVRTLRIGDINS